MGCKMLVRSLSGLFAMALGSACLGQTVPAAPAGPRESPSSRPAHWAEPLTVPGLPNLHRVSPELYRSAQPTAEGIQQLGALGIKTIVNLRSRHSDRDLLRATEVHYEQIPMQAWDPEEQEVVQFLRLVTDPQHTPVLVHCEHGADRAGAMCAVYRVAVEGWSKEEAVREMVQGGYGFHGIWRNLVRFINRLNIPRIQQRAGLGRAPVGN